jgi:hypothetical protein
LGVGAALEKLWSIGNAPKTTPTGVVFFSKTAPIT